jgi:DNA-binding response OmpR family regulator
MQDDVQPAGGPVRKTRLMLMVVEDESLIAMELEDMLEDLGHEVLHVAATTQSALAFLASDAQRVDAVILDANLGGKSSVAVARALAARGIPYFITSGYDPNQLERFGPETLHVGKPYDMRAIDAALRELRIG